MRLGQVGAVVPGMMRVVVNQPHFLEYKQQQVVSVKQDILYLSFFLRMMQINNSMILDYNPLPFFSCNNQSFSPRLSFLLLLPLVSHTSGETHAATVNLHLSLSGIVGYSPSTLIYS